MSRVMIHPATYADCRQAVERAFDLFPVAISGRKVLIKPNVLRASRAREGIVTHPAVLRSVVEKVEALAPAELVVGDNPGLFSYGANEESFRRTGLLEAAKGHYRNIGNHSRPVDFDPAFMPRVSVSRDILDADVVISLPKFKTHGLTVMTGAIKNSYGFLPGAQKARLHKAAGRVERFHDLIVEVFRLRIPELVIVDAVVGMEGNGPASRELRDIGLLLASDDAVALDAVIARMMGLEPNRLRFLQKARASGLGEYAAERIEILGEWQPLPAFKLPPLGGEASTLNEGVQERLRNRSRLRPRVDEERCTACGTCAEQCPVGALSLHAALPAVDADTCISCFCCQEICPEKAIALN